MRRTVVYAGTRNIYQNMAAAAKSLLAHTRVDRVYFMIEDDELPEELPDVIRCVNVSEQQYFPKDGPNYYSRWTYMTMIRLALFDLLPDEERVLWLDADTIVIFDIAELLEMDMGGKCLAMAEEPTRSKYPFVYHNAGVTLMDLNRLRETGRGKRMLEMVNSRQLGAVDQDAMNLVCQDEILTIDPTWNASSWTREPLNAHIMHFAADRDYADKQAFQEYRKKEWRVK